MSNWREQLSEESESKAVVELLTRYYHYPTLAFLITFAFWNRIRNWSSFVVDGTVYYRGNDPWYHYRSTQYAVENNLATMPFDPWTYFPFGTSTGQFGTLFDQIIALVILIIGLGSPSESLVRHTFLVAPAFFALAICIPAYIIGRRVGGRFGGVVTVGFIAFAPDRLLEVSLAGNVQHHSAEMLFMALSMLGVMVALAAAEREKPVYELVVAGEVDELRGTIGWSLLAGVAMGAYLWTWPPGVWLFGILGVFFVIHLSIKHIQGQSPEHAAFVGVISLVTAGILQLSTVRTLELSATSRSILHPGLAFLVAGGVVFMAWLSREVEQRDLSPYAYPGIVTGAIFISTALVAVVLPDLFSFFFSQVDRVFGFVTSPGTAAGTIGEAQPPDDRLGHLYNQYQLAVVTAAIGAAIIIARLFVSQQRTGEELLILVWAAFIVAATFTQIRFGYYLTIPIGALNAVLVSFLMKTIGSPNTEELTIETYQVMTVALIVLIMFVPLLGVPWIGADATAVDRADAASQPGDVTGWSDSLDFLAEDTPAPGQYGDPDGDPMELYGTYDRTDDYDYPDGAYGVLSWWDYGHWITAQGERIPNANPFQQGASDAADFFLAQDEDEALEVMEENFDDHENAQTRYVMIDWRMVETETIDPLSGKYFAPIDFHSEFERGDFFERLLLQSEEEMVTEQDVLQGSIMTQHQPYYDSMMSRLYHYHGSHTEPEPIGVDRSPTTDGELPIEQFESLEQAQEWVDDGPERTIGGFGTAPEESVEALEHFRLVHATEDVNEFPPQFSIASGEPWTKTFERVPGATIQGQQEELANEELIVSLPVEPENGEEFTYQQRIEADDDGSFSTTVPYATEGYDDWGVEEGYTDVSVRADEPYTIESEFDLDNETEDENQALSAYTGTANVTEGQVIGEDDSVVEVALEEEELDMDDIEAEGDDGDEEGETITDPVVDPEDDADEEDEIDQDEQDSEPDPIQPQPAVGLTP